MGYLENFERNTGGLEGLSTGPCPGCRECAADHGLTIRAYKRQFERGEIPDEPGFSWSSCVWCEENLGGNRSVFHYVEKRKVYHDSGVCDNCVVYLANGEMPEDWRE